VSEQTWSLIVGFLIVVGFRLLDWAFPKGYVWRKMKEWSEPREGDDEDSDETSIRPRSPS
jgi:hypothetical protein